MISDFVSANLGKIKLVPDPSHGIDGECVNLASSWSLAMGGPEFTGDTAYHIFQNFRHPFYEVILPGGRLVEGDIVFFTPNNPGAGTGFAGHVDIAIELYAGGFKGFDTNWNGDHRAQYANHSYNGVVGWFHPKGAGMDTDKFLQDGDTVNYYRAFEGRDPSADELSYWRNKTFKKIYYDNALGQATSLRQQLNNPTTINHDSVIKYVENNLK